MDRSEFRGARFEEDETDQQVLRATNGKLARDRYTSRSAPVPFSVAMTRKRARIASTALPPIPDTGAIETLIRRFGQRAKGLRLA